jgi:hypothetical protein
VNRTPNFDYIPRMLQHSNNLGCRYTARHRIDSSISHYTARVDDEHRWFCDAASLVSIQKVPFPNDAAFHIAQQRKGQRELRAQSFRFRGCIDGNGGHVCA